MASRSVTAQRPIVTDGAAPTGLPQLTDRAKRDMQMGLDELAKHRGNYRRGDRYHRGDIPEVFASVRLRRAMARSGMEFEFNFARTPVDAIADRLEITAVKSENDAQTKLLQRIWEDNELDLEAPEIHTRAGTFGDAYVIVWPMDLDDEGPDEEDDTDPESPLGFPQDLINRPDDDSSMGDQDESVQPGAGRKVGIFYNSPEVCRVFYDPEFPRKIVFAIKRWELSRTSTPNKPGDHPNYPPIRVDLYYADRIERYITVRGKRGTKAEEFTRYIPGGIDPDDDSPWPVANPFGRVPVFHFRNGRPYGRPDHQGFYGPQNAINKLIISHMAGVDYQSFPQRWALVAPDGDSSEAAALDEDEFAFGIDTGNTVAAGGEAQSTFSADPGSLWFMRGVTGVGQFQVADPKVFLDPVVTYIKAGAQITNTPLHYFDVAGQVPSGESLRAAEAPFVKRIRHRQLSYGATWRDVFQFALLIMGQNEARVQIAWAPPATVDDAAGWSTNQLKMDAGIPPKQVFMESGYSEEQATAWAPALDLDSMVKIAQVLVGAGTAVQAGAIDEATVQELVARMLPPNEQL